MDDEKQKTMVVGDSGGFVRDPDDRTDHQHMQCIYPPREIWLAFLSPSQSAVPYDEERQSSIPAEVISPSTGDQNEPAIDGLRVVWSEKMGCCWQIVLFDLATQTHQQLTFDRGDHIYPSIQGDIVIWWEGEIDGAHEIGGFDLSTGMPFSLSRTLGTRPRIGDGGVVWVGSPDFTREPWLAPPEGETGVTLHEEPVEYFSFETQSTEIISWGVLPNYPDISGNVIVWEDYREGSAIHGYDLTTGEEFTISNALGLETAPNISGNIVVWEDSRNEIGNGRQNHDIYAYDLHTQSEFVISDRRGNETNPKISGDIVVWADTYSSHRDVYAYDLSTETLITIAANEHDNMQPDVSGRMVVWTQWQGDHAQIMIGAIPTQP